MSKDQNIKWFRLDFAEALAVEARCPMCRRARKVAATPLPPSPAADDQEGTNLPIICEAHRRIRGRIALEGMRTWRQVG